MQGFWRDSTNLIVPGAGGGDGAVVDGASALIKATVLDYVNSNPLAVRLTDTNGDYVNAASTAGLTDAQLRATAVEVSGPVTDVQLRAAPVPVSGPLTDAQLRAAPVDVDPGIVAVTGPLTDVQLRATAVPVSGPLTDVQLRATAVPVSGPLTDSQLRASPVDVAIPTTNVTDLGFFSALGTGAAQSITAVAGGALPVGTTWFELLVVGGTINYRGDGVNPTAADGGGMTIGFHSNDPGVPIGIQYEVSPLADFKFITRNGTPRLLLTCHGAS